MEFLIQHNLMNEAQLELTKKAVEPYPHQFVGMIPFSREITSDKPLVGQDYIPYGSTLMTTVASQGLGWKGMFFDMDTFNYQAAVDNRDDMLNHGMFLGDLRTGISILENRGNNELFFLRPSHDLKQFSGQVIPAAEAAAWLRDAMECDSSGTYRMEPTTQIVIDTPKCIKAEWRWFVVGGKVISGSMYRFKNQLMKRRELDPMCIAEAQALADKWLPSPCCVMDLALWQDRLYVIEFNCINSSGFYDNDVNAIFKALYEYCSTL